MKRLLAILALVLVLTASGWTQTRFYLPSSGTSPLNTLAFSAIWTAVKDPPWRFPCSKTKTSTATENFNINVYTTDIYGATQFVSGQLVAYSWTTADTIKFQAIQVTVGEASVPYFYLSVRVVSADGLTVRGILYEGSGPTAMSASWTNRSIGAGGAHVHVQNSVAQQAGDRIVIEHGGIATVSNTTNYVRWYDDAVADLPEDETDTSTKNPWCEFSPTIADYSGSSGMINNILVIIHLLGLM